MARRQAAGEDRPRLLGGVESATDEAIVYAPIGDEAPETIRLIPAPTR